MRLTMIICLLMLCSCKNENGNRNLAALLLKKGGGVCGAPSNSLDLFLYQMTQVPGPSTGNPPWNTSYCRPNTSVTTASSFAEQTFVSEAITAMGNFAMAISGLNSASYIDGTGISFNTLSSGTGRPSGVSAISSEWFYDASGTYVKKTRRGAKTISGGTSYLPLASNLTENNPITGCPSNSSSAASPLIVDVVETTSYDYSDIMNVKEDLSYTCNGVQAKGPGFIQRKIYSLDSLLRIKSIVVYVNGDFSVKTEQDGVTKNYKNLFQTNLSANPGARVDYSYSPDGRTVTAELSGNYVKSVRDSSTAPYTDTLTVTDKKVGIQKFTISYNTESSAGTSASTSTSTSSAVSASTSTSTSANTGYTHPANLPGLRLSYAYGLLTCNAESATANALTVLYPNLFQSRGFCTSTGTGTGSAPTAITSDSASAYTQSRADSDRQTWKYSIRFDSQRPANMTSLTETNTYNFPVPAPGSGYFQNQYTKNYFWIYDDRGRIVRDSTYIYSYDSIGLLSYSKGTDNSIVEFFSR